MWLRRPACFGFFLPTHTDDKPPPLMLWRQPASWECLPFYLRRSTQRMTDDHLHHLSWAHCLLSLSLRSQFSAFTLSHIAHIVAASSAVLRGCWAFRCWFQGEPLIISSWNRHSPFAFVETGPYVSFFSFFFSFHSNRKSLMPLSAAVLTVKNPSLKNLSLYFTFWYSYSLVYSLYAPVTL